MMWLRRAMGLDDMERPKPSPISPIENNPVGWSSIYAPEVATNPSPDFSPLASSVMMTPEQKMGRFWNVATKQAKQAYTNADLPQLTKAGNEAYDSAAGFLNSTNPIRAYHGSPHTFDRFDLSKIGTGEGAQAYGHGLYFAGNEKVAKGYRDTLSGGKLLTKDGALLDAESLAGADGIAARFLASHGGDFAEALKEASRFNDPAVMQAAFAKLQASGVKPAPGSMYEVNLRTSPERLLDWDKPLAAQPIEARNIATTLERLQEGSPFAKPIQTGADLYHAMRSAKPARELGYKNWSSSGPAQYLKETGLDGIQYLDAGSRAAGDGSRNYVMFRDDIIDILKRYGLFGLGMVGASQAGPYGEANP